MTQWRHCSMITLLIVAILIVALCVFTPIIVGVMYFDPTEAIKRGYYEDVEEG